DRGGEGAWNHEALGIVHGHDWARQGADPRPGVLLQLRVHHRPQPRRPESQGRSDQRGVEHALAAYRLGNGDQLPDERGEGKEVSQLSWRERYTENAMPVYFVYRSHY